MTPCTTATTYGCVLTCTLAATTSSACHTLVCRFWFLPRSLLYLRSYGSCATPYHHHHRYYLHRFLRTALHCCTGSLPLLHILFCGQNITTTTHVVTHLPPFLFYLPVHTYAAHSSVFTVLHAQFVVLTACHTYPCTHLHAPAAARVTCGLPYLPATAHRWDHHAHTHLLHTAHLFTTTDLLHTGFVALFAHFLNCIFLCFSFSLLHEQ